MNANKLMLDIQQKVLSATFSHNMAVLKKEMPAIYQYFENYTPQNVRLVFDELGQVNLSTNGGLVYKGNPLVESHQQVEKFIKEPIHTTYGVSQKGTYIYEHEKVLQAIFDKKESDIGKARQYNLANNQQIDFIAVMGSGLGYHLEALFQKFSIRSALIYEPEPDCFYATLHTIDIKKLIDNCKAYGGELTFKIGGNSNAFINEISSMLSRIGYFHVAKMHLYRHYLSDKNDGAFKMVHELGYRFVQGWGFAEDEIIGITHTLSNYIHNKYPTILTKAKDNKRLKPVFVIGNGPSLDDSFEFLKENQNNAVIVSCGTALKPLLDKGIVPDIHIEQERPVMMNDWLQKVGHQKTLKNMQLICLNTVFPGILESFKQAHIMLKPNDLGATFVQNYMSKDYAEIGYCNPTVTNAGTAIMISMGFKSLFLFGIDYGFHSETHHHSKESLHYKDNEGLAEIKITADFKVNANFGGEVWTSQTFDQSRMTLELLLQANPDVLCVNTSNGAKIALTNACHIDDLPHFKLIDNKEQVVLDFLRESFDRTGYEATDFSKEFILLLPQFRNYINQLIASTEKVKTRIDLSNAFALQHKFINDGLEHTAKLIFKRFISGTLNYMQAYIMSNAYSYGDIEKQEEYIKFCVKQLNEHFAWLLNDLFEHYNKAAKF